MKIGYGLVAALAAAVGAAATAPVQAQGLKLAKTMKPAAAKTAAPAAAKAAAVSGPMSEVVGTINDKKFTFGEVVERAHKENPSVFNQTVAQLVGLDAAASLYGPTPKSSYSVTKSHVASLLREKNPQLLGDTLKTMLEFEAVDREVQKQGIVVTTAQVDTRIDQFLKLLRTQNRIPPNMTDAQFLEQNKVSRETLRKNFMVQAKLFTLIQQDYVEKRLKHKLTADDFFKTRHILIMVPEAGAGPTSVPGQAPPVRGQTLPQTPADAKKLDDAALAKITQIAADIESKKKTFEQAAKESSEDPGSKDMGGELGVQMRTVFMPEFEAAVYKLKMGEVSKPIRSKFGYHLIQLEQSGAAIPELERQQYLDNFESGQMRIFLRDLLTTKYKVTNKLARAQPQMMMPGQ